MARALLGLGSNLGDREGTIRGALAAIEALPDVRVLRSSEVYRSPALGGPAGQGEFFNVAAVVETKTPPLRLLDELKDIETRYGRQAAARWMPRTLDIDLLLYDNEVAETDMLTLPHLRMSFRRFVLEPAAKIAPRMLHPVIGWPIERLLLHLDAASDFAAIVSPSESLRQRIVDFLAERFGARTMDRPSFEAAERLWPAAVTSWSQLQSVAGLRKPTAAEGGALPYAAAAFPKLTVLLDAKTQAEGIAQSQWSAIVRQPGRGPTLRLQAAESAQYQAEVAAAVESVWPDLGPASAVGVE